MLKPGRTFISYPSPLRLAIGALDDQLREVGVPTWLDLRDFTAGPAESSLRSIIEDKTITQGLLVVTRDSAGAPFVALVEAPALLDKAREPSFSLVIAKDASLTVDEAATVVGRLRPSGAIRHWHMVSFDLAAASPFAAVVQAVLIERLKQIALSGGQMVLGLYTKTRPSRIVVSEALVIDWSHVYGGTPDAAVWTERLLPAARRVSTALREYLSHCDLVVRTGPASAACVVLGAHCLAQWGPPMRVEQRAYGSGSAALWSLAAKVKDSGFHCVSEGGDLESGDIALILWITADARQAFQRSHGHRRFRAYLYVQHRTTPPLTWIASAGEAVHVVQVIARAVREARQTYGEVDVLHMFVAAPASMLFLIGQSLSYVGAVQVYDYVASDATGAYEPGPLLLMDSLRSACR